MNVILLYGNHYLSVNTIVKSKKGKKDCVWIEFDLEKTSPNEIRSSIESPASLSAELMKKVVLIKNLQNKKPIKDFLISLCSDHYEDTTIILWDSDGAIKIDPKTNKTGKLWTDFINRFEKIEGAKVVNSGADFTEKENSMAVDFVVESFGKFKRSVTIEQAQLLIDIVGYDIGRLLSEIQKLHIGLGSSVITAQYISENAFPSRKESLIYKLNNVLNSGSYENSASLIDRFLDSGIHPYVLSEVMLKLARWQLVAAYLWSIGLNISQISSKIMTMGKFPASLWNDTSKEETEKQEVASSLKSIKSKIQYLMQNQGLTEDLLSDDANEILSNTSEDESDDKGDDDESEATGKKKGKKFKAETMPMKFIADQIVAFVVGSVVRAIKTQSKDAKKEVLSRGIVVYLSVMRLMREIRYGSDQKDSLYQMAKLLTSQNTI